MRNVLLAVAAVVLLPGSVLAAPRHPPATVTLWDQNANFGPGVVSDNFLNNPIYGQPYDAAAADDFVVPVGQSWHITEVKVTGAYVESSGPQTSVTISIYTSKNNRPKRTTLKHTFTLTNCTDDSGSFDCVLPAKPVLKLRSGTWWVSVVANCDYNAGCNEWTWTENTSVTGIEAMWDNPSDGWDNPNCGGTWGPVSVCFGTAADMAFTLYGTSSG